MEPRSISHSSKVDLLFRCSSVFIASPFFPIAASANAFQMPIDITFKVGDAQATAEFIENNCHDMLAAARETGRVLYRGYNDLRSTGSFVVTEKSDLLDPSTYGSLLSTEYFSALDTYLTSKDSHCIPSSGHIATPSSMAALQWGSVVSVWPLDELRYVWLRDKGNALFWREEWSRITSEGVGPEPLFWRNKDAMRAFCDHNVVIDRELELALERGSEVMFSRKAVQNSTIKRGDFLIVPLVLESTVLKLLGVTPFNPVASVKILKENSAADDVKTSRSLNQIIFGEYTGPRKYNRKTGNFIAY